MTQSMGEYFKRKGDFPVGTLYVGIDIAKYRQCARAIDGKTGACAKSFWFINRAEGFERFLAQVSRWRDTYESARVAPAMEPTARYWIPLFEYLRAAGYDVRTVSSLKVKQIKNVLDNSPLKSDPKDALIIATLLKDGHCCETREVSEDIKAIKILLAHYEDISQDIRRAGNRLEQFTAEYFPELEDVFKDMGSPTVRALLRTYPFPADVVKAGKEEMARFLWDASRGKVVREKAARLVDAASTSVGVKGGVAARATVRRVIDHLGLSHSFLEECKREMVAALKKIPFYENLTSIPGVGDMAALGDMRGYSSAREILKKAGLNLYRHSSGKFHGVDRISHRGNALLRKILYMSAVYQTNARAPLYEYYQGIASRKKSKKIALVAVMRKILKIAYALVRDGRKFDDPANGKSAGAARDVAVMWRAEAA